MVDKEMIPVHVSCVTCGDSILFFLCMKQEIPELSQNNNSSDYYLPIQNIIELLEFRSECPPKSHVLKAWLPACAIGR
jgi:hypothetical protein